MKRFLYYWFPVLAVAGVIFYASSMPYSEQDLKPGLLSLFNFEVLRPYLSWISFSYAGHLVSVDALGVDGFIEFFIRKAAHFTVFFALGFFTIRLCYYYRWTHKKSFWIAILFVILYAISDETHQYFTGDRTPLFQDVVIDSSGGLVGVTLYGLHRRNWFFNVTKSMGLGAIAMYGIFLICAVGILFFSGGFIKLYEFISPKLGVLINGEMLENRLSQYAFIYGGQEISVAQLGVKGFLEFFVKKGITGVIFFVVGYMLCSLFLQAAFKRRTTVLSSVGVAFLLSFLLEKSQSVATLNWWDVLLYWLLGIGGILLCLWWKHRHQYEESYE